MNLVALFRSSCLGLITAVVSQTGCLTASAASLDGSCDPGLRPAGGGEIGYTNRGDRCEGLYAQDVSGGVLDIVSLTEQFHDHTFGRENVLLLEWPPAGNVPVRVRASSLKRRLYYRMDSLRPSGASSFNWPTEILSRLELSRSQIGLLAWAESPPGTNRHPIYLPIRDKPRGSPDSSERTQPNDRAQSYKIVLMSSVELQAVYVTLHSIDSNGKPSSAIRTDSELDLAPYPAQRPIAFSIPFSELSAAKADLFSLSIGAESRNGGIIRAPPLVFLHAGTNQTPGKAVGGRP